MTGFFVDIRPLPEKRWRYLATLWQGTKRGKEPVTTAHGASPDEALRRLKVDTHGLTVVQWFI